MGSEIAVIASVPFQTEGGLPNAQLEMMAREDEALPCLRRLMVLEGADSTELQSW